MEWLYRTMPFTANTHNPAAGSVVCLTSVASVLRLRWAYGGVGWGVRGGQEQRVGPVRPRVHTAHAYMWAVVRWVWRGDGKPRRCCVGWVRVSRAGL